MKVKLIAALLVSASVCSQDDFITSFSRKWFPEITRTGRIERTIAQKKFAGECREFLKRIQAQKKELPAAVCLAFVGQKPDSANLWKLLKSENEYDRAAAFYALAELRNDSIQKMLDAITEEKSDAVLLACVRALYNACKERSSDKLKSHLKKAEGNKLKVLHAALCWKGDAESQAAIANMLPDKLALLTIVNMHPLSEDLMNKIQSLRKETADEKVREAATDALVSVGWLDQFDFMEALKSNDDADRKEAVAALLKYRFHKATIYSHLIQRVPRDSEFKKLKDPLKEFKSMYDRAAAVMCKLHSGTQSFKPTDKSIIDDLSEWFTKNRGDLVDADVNRAIDMGVIFLYDMMNENNYWMYEGKTIKIKEESGKIHNYHIGTTALCIYTLLECGEKWWEEPLASSIDWLIERDPTQSIYGQTYTVALMIMALSHCLKGEKAGGGTGVEDARIKKARVKINDLVKHLVAAQQEEGGWGYAKYKEGKYADDSNTQFALLALRSAANVGISVPGDVWKRAFAYTKSHQQASGGWVYAEGDSEKPRDSMTSAGIGSIVIEMLSLDPKADVGGNEQVKKGISWLEKNYPIDPVEPIRGSRRYHLRRDDYSCGWAPYYNLYSLERAMMLTGTKKLAGRDWYEDGAIYLLYQQLGNGGWKDVIDTCFALLFLKKSYVTTGR